MGININISGTSIGGNAKVLNNMKVEDGNTNIRVEKTQINQSARVLNGMQVSNGDVNIGVKKSNIGEDAKVLNNMKVEDGKVDLDLEELNIANGGEFMENRMFSQETQERVHYTKKENAHTRDIHSDNETFKSEETRKPREGILKRILKAIIKDKTVVIEEYHETYSSKQEHTAFEDRISNSGKLKNLDTSAIINAIHEGEKTQENQKEEEI